MSTEKKNSRTDWQIDSTVASTPGVLGVYTRLHELLLALDDQSCVAA